MKRLNDMRTDWGLSRFDSAMKCVKAEVADVKEGPDNGECDGRAGLMAQNVREQYVFSYENYAILLDEIVKQGTLCDYSEISLSTEKFIILRHDVEFSPRRALVLAEAEQKKNVTSTFFFQVSNNAYNTLSDVNLERIRQIHHMGHHIGLHFHLQKSNDLEEIRQRIIFESALLSRYTGIAIDRFSFHRPSELVLKSRIQIPGLINAYDPLYFVYSEKPEVIDFSKRVKYIADSRNEWSYISPWDAPCHEFFETFPKIQILCHPYSWGAETAKVADNLRNCVEENRREFIDTMCRETKYVKEYANEL